MRERIENAVVVTLAGAAIAVVAALSAWSCVAGKGTLDAASRRQGQAEGAGLTAGDTSADTSAVKVGDVDLAGSRSGDEAGRDSHRETTIGGDGDSVTTWIMTAGYVIPALFYPLVWRPVRRWREECGRKGTRDRGNEGGRERGSRD